MRDYKGNDNRGQPKSNYLTKISEMDIEALRKETEDRLWISAYAWSIPRSDYHWQGDACYDELLKRTGDTAEYTECYNKALER